MGRIKPRVPAHKGINELQNACKDYINAVELSVCSAVSTDGISYGTEYVRLQGTQSRVETHWSEKILSVEKDK
jgi:hypothetical protein